MSKYQKLYSLSENLYAEGAPLIIAAGALQKDTENGSVFAQIKFKNIDNRTIKAVRVVISAFDDFGKELGDKEYLYQDISARRDDEFGQKMPVVLDNATRSFNVKVSEVAFEDGSKWTDNGTELKPIEKQEAINSLLKEHELIKQYHIKYGNSCEYIAKTDRDLVLCSCGAIHKTGETICHNCRNNLSDLLSLDVAALTAEKDARLAEEAKAAEEKRIAEKKAAKKRRKAFCIGTPIVCACVAFVIVLTTVIIPNKKYNAAVELMTNGQYYEAKAGFGSIIGYKDSKEYYKAIISRPQKAVCTYSDGDTCTYTYEYNSAGNLTKEVYTNSYGYTETYTYTYEYDSAGNLTKMVCTFSDGYTDTYTYTYEYDSAGNLTKKVQTDSDGDTYTYTYEYDSAGNLTKKVQTDSDGDTYTYTYEYDSAGNLIKEVRTDSDGYTETNTYTYEFDSAGNITKKWQTLSNKFTDGTIYSYTYSDFICVYNPQK